MPLGGSGEREQKYLRGQPRVRILCYLPPHIPLIVSLQQSYLMPHWESAPVHSNWCFWLDILMNLYGLLWIYMATSLKPPTNSRQVLFQIIIEHEHKHAKNVFILAYFLIVINWSEQTTGYKITILLLLLPWLIRTYWNGSDIKRTKFVSNLLKCVTIPCVTSKEELLFWSKNTPTPPKHLQEMLKT